MSLHLHQANQSIQSVQLTSFIYEKKIAFSIAIEFTCRLYLTMVFQLTVLVINTAFKNFEIIVFKLALIFNFLIVTIMCKSVIFFSVHNHYRNICLFVCLFFIRVFEQNKIGFSQPNSYHGYSYCVQVDFFPRVFL